MNQREAGLLSVTVLDPTLSTPPTCLSQAMRLLSLESNALFRYDT